MNLRCAKCGLPYPLRADYTHVCPGPRIFHVFYRLTDDHIIDSFCCVGADATDPLLAVETLAPDGTTQRWAMRREDGMVVFYPPDGYSGGQGMVLRYSKEIQKHQLAPREVLERYALRHRVSLTVH